MGEVPATRPSHCPSRRLTWFALALAVALAPFAVSAVALAFGARGYHAAGDLALTELTVRSVGAHLPEVGVYSTHGWFHPGPMLFYLLAGPFRLFGGRSVAMLLAALTLNAASVVAIGLVARRRAGTGFAVLTLAGVCLLTHSLGATIVRSTWNPYLLILPFVLLVLLAWSVMEGDVAMLPWMAAVASFVVQSHVGTAEPVVVITLTALLALGVRRRTRTDEPRPPLGRPVTMAALLAVILWLPPLIDAVFHDGGNLRVLFDYFRGVHTRTTLGSGVKTVAGQLTLRPPWIRGNPFPVKLFTNRYDVPAAPVPWLGAALVAGTIVAWRRGEHAAARFGLLVAIALLAAVVTFSRVPDGLAFWFVSWVPGLGMLAAVATVWTFWRAFGAHRPAISPSLRRATVAVAVGVFAVPTVLLAVASADSARVPNGRDSRSVAEVAPATIAALHDVRGPVVVRFHNVFLIQPAFVLLLDQHGVDAVVDPSDNWLYASSDHLHGRRPGAILTVISPTAMATYRPAPGERLVAGRIVVAPPPQPTRDLTRAQLDAFARKAIAAPVHYAVYLRILPASR